MDISLPALAEMGKIAFEQVVIDGQYFFPKLAFCYLETDKVEIAQYGGEIDELEALLKYIGRGPLDWISHTGDGYQLAEADMKTLEEYLKHNLDLPTMFEDGDPRVSEAVIVSLVTRDGWDALSLPYRRRGAKVEWLDETKAGVEHLYISMMLQDALRKSLVA